MSRTTAGATCILGETAPLPFATYGDTLRPQAPDSTPTFQIRNPAGLGTGDSVITGSVTSIGGVAGGYSFYVNASCTVANGFVSGVVYTAIITYAIGGITYPLFINFTVA